MWREIAADDRIEVDVDGFKVVAYSFGSGSETVFCLNGGPGLPCDYLREAHSCLVDQGYRVVAFDQLGTGASDRPTDASLWTIARYVEETETVRKALGLGKVHMLGHSWGGWLAIDYALAYQENLKTLILEDTVADMPHLVLELERLRAALGPETVAMMQRHEAQGTYDHPEYMAAMTILNYRHVCRLAGMAGAGQAARSTTGTWARTGRCRARTSFSTSAISRTGTACPTCRRIKVPVLITCGEHDELTPACAPAHEARPAAGGAAQSFPNASHMPFYEKPAVPIIRSCSSFLSRNRAG